MSMDYVKAMYMQSSVKEYSLLPSVPLPDSVLSISSGCQVIMLHIKVLYLAKHLHTHTRRGKYKVCHEVEESLG